MTHRTLATTLFFSVLVVASSAFAQPWYYDGDLDGFGDDALVNNDPTPPPGYVAQAGDCDDSDGTVYPGAPELVDGQDNDCDGFLGVEEFDGDGDGYVEGRIDLGGWDGDPGVVGGLDCHDNDATVYPGAPELIDGQDNDCDGHLHPDEVDADGDGYISGTLDVGGWDGSGYATYLGGGDCDDQDAWVHPTGAEVCDGRDNDCNGTVDDGMAQVWYRDIDRDGWGTTSETRVQCASPGSGWSWQLGDCDDSDPNVNPGVPEFCDGVDNDCSGFAEDDAYVYFYADMDGDGFGGEIIDEGCLPTGLWRGGDCDDGDPNRNPGESEVCNGIDDDCNLVIDENCQQFMIYVDSDGDGWGALGGMSINADTGYPLPPVGYSLKTGDCDDTDDYVHPHAPEFDDGVDNDCDGPADEGLIEAVWYQDFDVDGYGLDSAWILSSEDKRSNGLSIFGGDCDDSDPNRNPGESEVCNGIDDDCDTVVDEDGNLVFSRDSDGDGWGTSSDQVLGCTPPPGYVSQSGDCNDADPDIYPGAPELCDDKDNDCNGEVDEGLVLNTYWRDADADGYGDAEVFVEDCGPPVGYVANDQDCNDADPEIHPGVAELCDGRDNDCNDLVDDGLAPTAFYRDADGDGYGRAGTPQYSCIGLDGYVANDLDCDDGDASTYPGAVELCDGRDNNCDGSVDEGVMLQTFYVDADRDGYAPDATEVQVCEWEPGLTLELGDTDDTNPWIYPGAPELCDGLDNDGDGEVDEDVQAIQWYVDQDADGYGGAPFMTPDCHSPLDVVGVNYGFSTRSGDCDDSDPYRFPAAPELCDGLDNDCDGTVDNGLASLTVYLDDDGDGWGQSGTASLACGPRAGWAVRGGDCDDQDPAIHPDNVEFCDGVDNDCDGQIDEDVVDLVYYYDVDEDGYGDPANPAGSSCNPIAGAVLEGSDCDDTRPEVYPGAPEYCDGLDNDCDGQVDEDVQIVFYRDFDEDGWGDAGDTTLGCDPPFGYVEFAGDCDDQDPGVNPGATESCNGIDDDCDGEIDNGPTSDGSYVYYVDADGDGYGNALGETALFCTVGTYPGYSDNDLDCADDNADAYPGAPEVCNGIDDNCDGEIDETCKFPRLVSIEDVGNDQGRNVRIRWLPPEILDQPGAPETVTGYGIYRRIAPGMRVAADEPDAAPKGSALKAYPPGEWDFVSYVPATGESAYSAVAQTLCDSTDVGICWSVFFLRAHTPDPLVYFDAAPDSGYSIDNLFPAAPLNLVAGYSSTGNALTWDANLESDLRLYRIYRSTDPGFTPTLDDLVATSTASAWTDPSNPGFAVHYRVSAVDQNGNESAPAAPVTVTGTEDPPTVRRFALGAAKPNPFNPRTTISFDLPRAVESLRLEVFDLAGRRVSVLASGSYGAGRHDVDWDACDHRGRALSSGVYLYRLRADEFEATRRMTLLR